MPERKCVACGRKVPKSELVRIARTPQGAVVADPTGKSPGRGAYLCSSLECWEQGLHKNVLERGLRSPISAQDRDQLHAFYRAQISGQSPLEN
ncbi:MAG: RNase P modulator RnpM [Dehalococcoidia bacterium]